MPVSMLSRYLVTAREGHLEQVFHVFAYLKAHERSTMVFDDTEPNFDERRFKICDWSEYYPNAAENIPRDMPTARGKPVVMSCFVDADHAGCRATRRSHTGIIIFINQHQSYGTRNDRILWSLLLLVRNLWRCELLLR